ncbi:MAG: PPOX class F420-dependent oxidoreductase [Chloroflexi bacterium]|nr:PPOX class F420-dependent oxidoreductase [Chloroflexota bacterium]
MAVRIPDKYRDLLERPVFVALATVNPDGQPQVTPVWCSYDGTHVLINTARGRQKDQNMTRNPRVTIMAIDPDNPYRWMEIRGRVDEVTEEGGVEHINFLSGKYTGNDDYYRQDPGQRQRETRVIYKITPTHVNASG